MMTMIHGNQCSYNFRVLPVESFYSIHYLEAKKFFNATFMDEINSRLKNAVVVHMWNALTDKVALTRDSNAPYVQLAKFYCPRTIASSYVF